MNTLAVTPLEQMDAPGGWSDAAWYAGGIATGGAAIGIGIAIT